MTERGRLAFDVWSMRHESQISLYLLASFETRQLQLTGTRKNSSHVESLMSAPAPAR
jgi:hypothetical protein